MRNVTVAECEPVRHMPQTDTALNLGSWILDQIVFLPCNKSPPCRMLLLCGNIISVGRDV
jgi:hypothetical protein